MNLTELRNKVKAITDYSPELAVYNEQLDMFLNDAYYALWTKKRWTFAERRTFMDIYPDVGPKDPTSDTTATLTAFNNSRYIQFDIPIHQLAQTTLFEGQILTIDAIDYGIQKVVSTTDVQLDRPFRDLNSATFIPYTTTNWVLKHRFYDLPQDAIELLFIGHRDTPVTGQQPPYGAVRGLLARRDEDVNLKEDWTSFYSECYIPTPVNNIPPGEKIAVVAVEAELGEGDFPDQTYMEFCWCWEEADRRLGPLSEPFIAYNDTATICTFQVAFATFDDQLAVAPTYDPFKDQNVNPFEGLRKRIFYNQNFNRATGQRLSGLPVWREVTYGSTSPPVATPNVGTSTDPVRVLDTAGSYVIAFANQCIPGNKRYLDYDGVSFRVRPYPRPIGYDKKYEYVAGSAGLFNTNNAPERLFRQWECRYYRKPYPLALPTDAPEFPMEFHQLIVYKALEDIYAKHDNMTQADNYRRRYEDELKRLETRYVDSVDVDVVRQQFGTRGRIWTPFDPNSLRRIS